jgi:hypothetical protein
VVRAKIAFFCGPRRRSANPARVARRFLSGVPRGYPSAGASRSRRAWQSRNKSGRG